MDQVLQMSNARRYSELISCFKRGAHLEVVKLAFCLEPTYLVLHYMTRSCRRVNAPLELIEYINRFVAFSAPLASGDRVSRIDLCPINSPVVEHLLESRFAFDESLNTKRSTLEKFVLENPLLFVHGKDLAEVHLMRLFSLMNILADTYRLLGRLRASGVAFKLATYLFPDSVYSRINYADLAYALHDIPLCLENLKHVNHLLYYSGNFSVGQVYDPYTSTVSPISELRLAAFLSLSCRCGFLPG